MLKEKIDDIKSGKLKAVDNIKGFLKEIEKNNKKFNIFLHVNKDAVKQAEEIDKKKKKGKLAGLGIAVKCNISVLDMPISCASKTLEDYYGTYDADVIKKIKAEDGIILGLVNCDEFASGASGESSAFGPTDNPAAPGRIPGGSSSGSAAAVAANMCDLSLGTDTGGSTRNPSSHCGVTGVKASYGRVSRYGMVDLAMSLEGISPVSKDVYGCALLLEVIAGKSIRDAVTLDAKVPEYTKEIKKKPKITIGVSKDFEKLCDDKRIYKLIQNAIDKLSKENGYKVKDVKLKYVDLSIQTYYPIVYVEFFSSTRKLDGKKYGKKIEDACGEEVYRRIMGGREISRAEHHGKYYRKALVAKKLIKDDFEKAFKEVDVILSPTTPRLPHKFEEKITDPKVMYAYDAYTCPANLAGICAGVVKAGEIEGIPVGLHIMAPRLKEELMLQVMKLWEDTR
ncbi:MAG: Asp-tRNA(Asn)/Glu-tRNA(Gln) amidotransferase subunit GatA [bacterium]|nr:Asp-tRNA(Asn)/Glu-tRNA(Gln) amidotransferase subunit GatA [bacterium]